MKKKIYSRMGVQRIYIKAGKNQKIKAYTNNFCQNPKVTQMKFETD